MKLIVGLGNPGRKFDYSRHNMGFQCVSYMARKWDIKLAERRAKAVLGQGHVADLPVVLARPRTFMNNSGQGVEYLLARFAASPADLVIIYDDMDLPLGKIRIRPNGSSAGHNGIKSIMATLSTQEFSRIRVGIDKPPVGVDGMDYVLAPFSPEERPVIELAVATVAEAVGWLIQESLQAAMDRFN